MAFSTIQFYTKGGYLQNNPSWDSEDAKLKAALIHEMMLQHNLNPVNITEVGCGAGGNLIELGRLNPAIQSFTGYDISPQAIAMARKEEDTKTHFFCQDFLVTGPLYSELLLLIDVLEHVEDYIGFLQQLKTKSKHFIFHIPLDLCCRTILKPHVLLQQRQSVGHLHYFSKEMIEWALADAGYIIVGQRYTKPVVDIAASTDFKRLIKKTLRNVSFSFFPHWSAKMWGGYSIMYLLK